MKILLLLLNLFETLLNPNFEPEDSIQILGEVTSKTIKRWLLIPKNDNFLEIYLHFENLPAGKNLMTTIEIKFKKPLTVTMNDLESIFGPKDRWLPHKGIGRPRSLQFWVETKHLTGAALFNVDNRIIKQDKKEDLTISSVLLRRIYSKL